MRPGLLRRVGLPAIVILVTGGLAGAVACSSSPASPDPAISQPTSSSPASPSPAPTPAPSPGASLTYTHDIQPILSASCTTCHNASLMTAGVDLSSYAGVMRTVTPGNANSVLILVTQPGGLMYGELAGNASQDASTIRSWVVDDDAAQ